MALNACIESTACFRRQAESPRLFASATRAGLVSTPKHAAPGCNCNLRRQQAQQAHADDGHGLADLWFRQPKTMQGDGSQRREGSRFIIHALGERGEQVAGNNIIFRVDGIASACTGHPLTHLKTFHSASNLDNLTRGGIPQCHGLVEPAEGCLDGWQDAFTFHFFRHLADKIGPRPGFTQQGFFSKFHQHSFSSRRNK